MQKQRKQSQYSSMPACLLLGSTQGQEGPLHPQPFGTSNPTNDMSLNKAGAEWPACQHCGMQCSHRSLQYHIPKCKARHDSIEVPCPGCEKLYRKDELHKHMRKCSKARMLQATPPSQPSVAESQSSFNDPTKHYNYHDGGSESVSSTPGNFMQCKYCKRSFIVDRIAKHQEVCFSRSGKARKEFESAKQRARAFDPTERQSVLSNASARSMHHRSIAIAKYKKRPRFVPRKEISGNATLVHPLKRRNAKKMFHSPRPVSSSAGPPSRSSKRSITATAIASSAPAKRSSKVSSAADTVPIAIHEGSGSSLRSTTVNEEAARMSKLSIAPNLH